MKEEFFANLQAEIIIDILSRLPVQAVASCRCVCKSWLDVLKRPEFVNSHLSRSVRGLIVNQGEIGSELLKIVDFDEDAIEELDQHDLHYNPVATINLPLAYAVIAGSVDGLLFLRRIGTNESDVLWICNPITRDFIEIPGPGKQHYPTIVTYGFGVSKTSGQYKAVWICHECERDQETQSLLRIPKSECRVYTVGTGVSWRSIDSPGAIFEYNCRSIGTFLNGNLHWIVLDLKGSWFISCLNLETERFSTLAVPPNLLESRSLLGGLAVLGDSLCLCDNTSDDEIVIWLMKEHGASKSWSKEYVVSKIPDLAGPSYEVVYLLKVFRDGDILMAWDDYGMFYYSGKSKKTGPVNQFELRTPGRVEAMLHTSSFVSLKGFVMENVSSF